MAFSLIDSMRWLGALGQLFLAAASLLVLITGSHSPLDPAQWLFLLPCFAVAAFAAWLSIMERRQRWNRR